MVEDLGLVRAGALAGYGPEYREYGRHAASYVARILAGARPAISPSRPSCPGACDQPQDGQGARPGYPTLLLARADEVIE